MSVSHTSIGEISFGDMAEIRDLAVIHQLGEPLGPEETDFLRIGLTVPTGQMIDLSIRARLSSDTQVADKTLTQLNAIYAPSGVGRAALTVLIDDLRQDISHQPFFKDFFDPDVVEDEHRARCAASLVGASYAEMSLLMLAEQIPQVRGSLVQENRTTNRNIRGTGFDPLQTPDLLSTGTFRLILDERGQPIISTTWMKERVAIMKANRSVMRRFFTGVPGLLRLGETFHEFGLAGYNILRGLVPVEYVDPVVVERQPRPAAVSAPKPVVEYQPRDESVIVALISSSPATEMSGKEFRGHDWAHGLKNGGTFIVGNGKELCFEGFGENARLAAGFIDRLIKTPDALVDDLVTQIGQWLNDAKSELETAQMSQENRLRLTTLTHVFESCLAPSTISVLSSSLRRGTEFSQKALSRLNLVSQKLRTLQSSSNVQVQIDQRHF